MAGCGDDRQPLVDGTAIDAADDDTGPADTTDTGADGESTPLDVDAAMDADGDADILDEPDSDADTCSDAGCLCELNDDCASGLCVEQGGSNFCTAFCSEADAPCEQGLQCVELFDEAGALTALCLRPPGSTCQPCTAGQCPVDTQTCMDVSGQETCAAPCVLGTLCAVGTTCQTIDDQSLCIPDADTCAVCIDGDNDGHGIGDACESQDCDDSDDTVFPGADELCDSRDNDCDGEIDEGFDLTSDAINCGACGNVCVAEEAVSACVESACTVTACPTGRADCDDLYDNGCESDVTAPDLCGGCELLPHAVGMNCGTCGDGVWACTDIGEQACEGDPGTERLNACGGCETLSFQPGAPCDEPCVIAECGAGDEAGTAVCVPNAAAECQPLPQVENVDASDGASPNAVSVSWEAVPGALRYVISRDGEEVGTVETLSFNDIGADAPELVAVSELTARDPEPGTLELTWVAPVAPDGRTHAYEVVAENHIERGPPGTDTGFRGHRDVISYLVQKEDTRSTVTEPAWVDEEGRTALPPISATLTATQGTLFDRIEIEVVDIVYAQFQTRYTVTPVYPSGVGPETELFVDNLDAEVDAYAFEYSNSGSIDEPWAPAATSPDPNYNDTEPPAHPSLRYYRAQLSSRGTTVATNVVSGYIGDAARWTRIAVNRTHACALRADGSVWCWGQNDYGQLGLGYADTALGDDEPVADGREVNLGGPAIDIGVGQSHSCALMADGSVRCWGRNSYGQLGIESRTTVGTASADFPPAPARLGEERITQLAVGYNHVCGIGESGAVLCWGANQFGQLGIRNDRPVGTFAGSMPPRPTWASDTGVVQVVADGSNQTCVLRDSGNVNCWGLNTFGALGNWTTDDVGISETASSRQPVRVLTSPSRRLFNRMCAERLSDGVTLCWGGNYYGELGNGTTLPIGDNPPEFAVEPDFSLIPVEIIRGTKHTCAMDGSGRVQCFGSNVGYGTTDNIGTRPEHLPGVDLDLGGPARAISGSGLTMCAILRNNDIRCWGADLAGILGNGAPQDDIGDELREMPPPPIEFGPYP
jgi:alpha-tubulin suppressor-like RCC1 family protein